jgi:polyhydroxybutyrate depolymerase
LNTARQLTFLLVCLLLCNFFFLQTSRASETKKSPIEIEIESDGFKRKAILYVPSSVDKNRKPSLVVLLHGGGGNAMDALESYGWAVKAEQQGFVVLAPEGLGARPKQPKSPKLNPAVWNSGQYASSSPIAAVNDVAFIDRLLEHTKTLIAYNEAKVYATGHSNGGGMTFRLGSELSPKFAAIAMVAGRLAIDNPKPTKALPTLYIVGTVDPLMPLGGGDIKSPWGGSWTNRPVAEQLSSWASAIQCETVPITVSDTTAMQKVVYSSKAKGLNPDLTRPQPSLSVLYVKDHGHHWPGAKQTPLPASVIGPTLNTLNATDAIWDFFKSNE